MRSIRGIRGKIKRQRLDVRPERRTGHQRVRLPLPDARLSPPPWYIISSPGLGHSGAASVPFPSQPLGRPVPVFWTPLAASVPVFWTPCPRARDGLLFIAGFQSRYSLVGLSLTQPNSVRVVGIVHQSASSVERRGRMLYFSDVSTKKRGPRPVVWVGVFTWRRVWPRPQQVPPQGPKASSGSYRQF